MHDLLTKAAGLSCSSFTDEMTYWEEGGREERRCEQGKEGGRRTRAGREVNEERMGGREGRVGGEGRGSRRRAEVWEEGGSGGTDEGRQCGREEGGRGKGRNSDEGRFAAGRPDAFCES